MRQRHPLIHLLLVFMLLVSQQVSFAHLLNHQSQVMSQAEEGVQPGKTGLAPIKLLIDQSCQECLSSAHFGLALPPHIPDFSVAAGASAVLLAMPDYVDGDSPSPYWSRGPPFMTSLYS